MQSPPTVSIIVPAARAEATLPDALESISSQDYSNIVEVVVAAADPASASVAHAAGVSVVENPTGKTAPGLNLAIAASTGEVIVRVDSHARIPRDYVSRAVATILETGAQNVGGMQVPVGNGFWERAIAAAMSSPAGAGDARYRIGGRPGPVETVYLGTYRRSTLDDLGGFDEEFVRHQDYELNERIRQAGGTVWFNPDLRVEYQPRGSLPVLAGQYFEYGSWKRWFARSHPGSLRVRQIIPPVFFGILILSLLLAIVWPQFLLFPVAYLLGLVVAAIGTIRSSKAAFVGVPLALAVMHLSWGAGFLVGQRSDS